MPNTSLAERRVFLRRLAQTLFMAAASGALGLAFWDPRGPDGGAKRNDAFVMPDFSGAGEGARMAIARGFDRIQGAESIIRALGAWQPSFDLGTGCCSR
jgi:hypothetical protein